MPGFKLRDRLRPDPEPRPSARMYTRVSFCFGPLRLDSGSQSCDAVHVRVFSRVTLAAGCTVLLLLSLGSSAYARGVHDKPSKHSKHVRHAHTRHHKRHKRKSRPASTKLTRSPISSSVMSAVAPTGSTATTAAANAPVTTGQVAITNLSPAPVATKEEPSKSSSETNEATPPAAGWLAWAHVNGIPPGGPEPEYIIAEPGGGMGTYRGTFYNVGEVQESGPTGTYCLPPNHGTQISSDSPTAISDVALRSAGGLSGTPSAVWVKGAPDCSAGQIEVQTYIQPPGSSTPEPAWNVSFTIGIYPPEETKVYPVGGWAHLNGFPPGGVEPMYIIDEPGGGFGTYRGRFYHVSFGVGQPQMGTYCLAPEYPAGFNSDSATTISQVALNTEGPGAGVSGTPSAVWVKGAPDCGTEGVEVQTYIKAPGSSTPELAWNVSFTASIA